MHYAQTHDGGKQRPTASFGSNSTSIVASIVLPRSLHALGKNPLNLGPIECLAGGYRLILELTKGKSIATSLVSNGQRVEVTFITAHSINQIQLEQIN